MNHLTDDQFAECLAAEAPHAAIPPAIQAHLAQCDECRTELGVFLAAMDDFSAAALDWSRSQPAPSSHEKLPPIRPTLPTPLRWALAAALIAAVGIPVAIHRDRSDLGPAVAQVEYDAGDSPAQIAQDNRLLQSVDLAIGQTDPSPYQEYRLDDPQKRSRARTQSRVE